MPGPSSTSPPGSTKGRIEQGLLGLAFPPDYRKSGRFYVQYTDPNDDLRIDEYRRSSPTFARASSRRAVLKAPAPEGYTNHNGGQLLFRGHLLYSGIGDGMDPGDLFNYAQSLGNLRGKIIRINPRRSKSGKPYRVPRTNPFVGRPGRDEIYSYGLRNPYRFSFQEVKGAPDRLLVGDVGENRFEEIDYEDLRWAWGGNFGWDAFEGDSPYDASGPCGIFCPNGDTPDPGKHPEAGPHLPARSPLRGDRRLRGPRPGAEGSCAGATSTATTAGGESAASSRAWAAPSTIARWASGSRRVASEG